VGGDLMTEIKRYTDVIRLGHRSTLNVLHKGDYVVIEEKLDGANASFRVDNGEVIAYSRNTQLSSDNNLRGFYEYTRNINATKLNVQYIYFGEWLVKHKIDYGASENEFYLFDVYDIVTAQYLPFTDVVSEAYRLGFAIVPVLYAGKYHGYEQLESIMGRSVHAKDPYNGEGIVVKNVSYRDKFDHQLYVKLVSPEFCEVQKQKAPRDPSKVDAESQFVRTFATKARVHKSLLKMVDAGKIKQPFDLSDMGMILKHLGRDIYDDLLKEESDSLPEGYEEKSIRRAIGKYVPTIVREIIEDQAVVI
jgi:hypothetical protein